MNENEGPLSIISLPKSFKDDRRRTEKKSEVKKTLEEEDGVSMSVRLRSKVTWMRRGKRILWLEDPVQILNLSDEVRHLLTDNFQVQGDPIRLWLEIPTAWWKL